MITFLLVRDGLKKFFENFFAVFDIPKKSTEELIY